MVPRGIREVEGFRVWGLREGIYSVEPPHCNSGIIEIWEGPNFSLLVTTTGLGGPPKESLAAGIQEYHLESPLNS